MRLAAKDWNNYIGKLAKINTTAAQKMQEYVDAYGLEDTDALIDQAYALSTKYGEAAGELACEMYDAVAEASGLTLPAAEMAETATYEETAKAIYGTMLNETNTVAQTVGRLVKQAGADTTLKNAQRDGAKFAWVPHGIGTCAFCITLASRGWQNISKRTLKNGHAEHIHANCHCEYAISFDRDPYVEGYDPDYYLKIYRNANGATPAAKIKDIRRMLAEQAKGVTTSEWEGEKLANALGPKYNKFKELVNTSGNKGLYDKFAESPSYHNDNRGYYQPSANAVHFGLEHRDGMSEYSTLAHEVGHMFDSQIARNSRLHFSEIDLINEKCIGARTRYSLVKVVPSSSDEFLTALRADMRELRPRLADGSLRTELLATEEIKNATAGIQDALDGFYSTQDKRLLPWGHGDRYYNRQYNQRFKLVSGTEKKLQEAYKELGFDASNLTKTKRISRSYEAASEAWANVSSAVTCGGKELECVKKYMPETYKTYMQIVEGIE